MVDAFPAIGPHFFKEGGKVMFKFVSDPNNVIGPIEATDSHKTQHVEAWDAFQSGEPRPVKGAAEKTLGKMKHKPAARKKAKA